MAGLTPNEANEVARIRSEFANSIKGPWSYDVYGQMIMLPENNGMIAMMRGWGHMTGDGPSCLQLSCEEAAKLQDDTGEFMAHSWENVVILLQIISRLTGDAS